jgi:HlyD family secretion protein
MVATEHAKLPAPRQPARPPGGDGSAALSENGRSLRRVAMIGFTVIVLFFGGFGSWAAFAPLASAALAVGRVSPDTNSKIIQHLEGGIIRQILVRDGTQVRAGDTLMVLDDTRDLAALEGLRMQRRAAIATMSRLDAEQSGADSMTLPDWLVADAASDPVVTALVDAQRGQFTARRDSILSQKSILGQRIAQSEEEINGLRAQIASAETQLALIEEEAKGVRDLVERGLERRPRLLQLQRAQAQSDGERASNVAAIARAQQTIGESRSRILGLDTDLQDRVAEERSRTQSILAELEEKLRAADDIVGRTKIVAPVDGTVVGLKFHTVGGVVSPGTPIMEIVPSNDKLVIDAQVQPLDIDVVHVGLPAMVRFTAYHQRAMPRIEGNVIYVAADSTLDEKSGRSYFLAKVQVDPAQIEKVAPSVQLSAGMPAELAITTGSRTMLEYLFDPLLYAFQRSFVED